MNICIISGTNRRHSTTRRVANLVDKTYQTHGLTPTVLDLVDLPAELLSPDAYSQKPSSFSAFTILAFAITASLTKIPDFTRTASAIASDGRESTLII